MCLCLWFRELKRYQLKRADSLLSMCYVLVEFVLMLSNCFPSLHKKLATGEVQPASAEQAVAEWMNYEDLKRKLDHIVS